MKPGSVNASGTTGGINAVGWYFTALQFLFALSWTVYVIFLPPLAERAGIERSQIIWILMADQVIFALMDVAMGSAADRVVSAYHRFARWLLLLSLASCAAFLVLPFATGGGPVLFIALIFIWSATSSALRAPPLVLIGRYAAMPAHAWLAGLTVLGLGLSGAVSPYIAFRLRTIDPAIPFVACNLALAVVTLGLTWAAKRLGEGARPAPTEGGLGLRAPLVAGFLAAALLAGAGFQLHTSINSVPQYMRFAGQGELENLLPLFWVGFNVMVLPACALARRAGAITVMAGAGLAGALALAVAASAGSLPVLIGAQLVAGAAWSILLMGAITAALALGHTGSEGRINGSLFAILALAAFARMGMVAAQLPGDPDIAPLLPWVPVAAWAAAGLLLAAVWAGARATARGAPRASLVGAA